MQRGLVAERQEGGSAPAQLMLARVRRDAIETLLDRRLLERRAADGRILGVQSQLSLRPDGDAALDLAALRDGLIVDVAPADAFEDEPARDDLLEVLASVERRLGFPLEPEFFSNMVFVAYLGHLPDPRLRELTRGLLDTYRTRSLFGLFGFFASMRFACDVDCTGVAMWGRLVTGELDLRRDADAAVVRTTTGRILKSAAVEDVTAAANESRGRSNGGLRRDVFKVYLDDHEIQGALLDRGLKQDAVVVCHALQPVLAEIRAGRRELDESVPLLEFFAGSREPRRRDSDVASIVVANLRYLAEHLDGSWRSGSRYYPMPEAFLCAASELCLAHPELMEALKVRAKLERALNEQSQLPAPSVLALALRCICADNLGIGMPGALAELLDHAEEGYQRFAPYYRMPSAERTVHFGSGDQTLGFVIRALHTHRVTPRWAPPQNEAGARAIEALRRML